MNGKKLLILIAALYLILVLIVKFKAYIGLGEVEYADLIRITYYVVTGSCVVVGTCLAYNKFGLDMSEEKRRDFFLLFRQFKKTTNIRTYVDLNEGGIDRCISFMFQLSNLHSPICVLGLLEKHLEHAPKFVENTELVLYKIGKRNSVIYDKVLESDIKNSPSVSWLLEGDEYAIEVRVRLKGKEEVSHSNYGLLCKFVNRCSIGFADIEGVEFERKLHIPEAFFQKLLDVIDPNVREEPLYSKC